MNASAHGRAGLVSVTFRQLSPEEIVRVAREAGLTVIEWGGDVHVPPGDSTTRVLTVVKTKQEEADSCHG